MFHGYEDDESLLHQMFSNGGRDYRPRARRSENSVVPYSVTLEDLYKGKTAKLKVSKNVLCGECEGLGGKSGKAGSRCEECRGSGEVLLMRRVGPMIEQMRSNCNNCYGRGKIVEEKDKCKKCDGKMVVPSESIIKVNIKPGMRDRDRLVFYGEGDQEPGHINDLILVLEMQPHEVFRRKDSDLFIEREITLKEALCGYSAVLKHLDGRNLHLSTNPGELIQPDSFRGVIGEGMPIADSKKRGDLYIRFSVCFPPNILLSENQFKKLEAMLPPRPALKIPAAGEVEEVSLSDYDQHRYQPHHAHEAYQEDSDQGEEEGMPGRPQNCSIM